VTGRELVGISPGDRPYRVRAPGWLARTSQWLRPLEGLALWRRRADVRTIPARTRGGDSVTCRYRPDPAPEAVLKAIDGWGPVLLSWRCPDVVSGDWRVTIVSGKSRQAVVTATNMVSINPAACGRSCTIEVAPDVLGFGQKTYRLEVMSAAEAGVPPEIAGLSKDAVGRARLGAWLINRRGPELWVQAMSLLWLSGCAIPSAGQAAATLYGSPSPEDMCF
jgi:hypothetical protein